MSELPKKAFLQKIKSIFLLLFITVGMCMIFILVFKRHLIKPDGTKYYYIGNVLCFCFGSIIHEGGHIVFSTMFHAEVKAIKLSFFRKIIPVINVVLSIPENLNKTEKVFMIAGGLFSPVYIGFFVSIFFPYVIAYMDMFILITALNIVPIFETDGNKIRKTLMTKVSH